MPSKGGGVTEVQLQVTKESFEPVARAMVEASDDAAVVAFVATERFGQLAAAMIEADEDEAVVAFASALSYSEDRIVKAYAELLRDKWESRSASNSKATQLETLE
jgi:hypothetical protein